MDQPVDWPVQLIRKIALDTESAAMNMLPIAVQFIGANSPKLIKMVVSQRMTMTSMGVAIEVSPIAYRSQRVLLTSAVVSNASALVARCISFSGASFKIESYKARKGERT